MQILILGGTQFVGRHLTQAALDAGYEVSLFNRGRSNPDLFPQVETLIGDRDGGLEALKGRKWDAVIDVNGYVPRLVRDSGQLLADHVGRYCFISTISVYDFEAGQTPLNEDAAPLRRLSDPSTETITGETYGGLKVLCEEVVIEIYGARGLNIRPGLVVGPYDHTYRFNYWLGRAAEGGRMLAPGAPSDPMQFIDGRDLAAFTLKLIGDEAGGTYNATGPNVPLTFGEVLNTAAEVSESGVIYEWVNSDFLLAQGLTPHVDFPFWMGGGMAKAMHVGLGRSIAAGLVHRPLAEIVRDTLPFAIEETAVVAAGSDVIPATVINRAREAELLAAWDANQA